MGVYPYITASIIMQAAQAIKELQQKNKLNHKIERIAQFSEPPPLENIGKQYAIILADPPWRYDFSIDNSDTIESHYPTMALEDICNLAVPKIAANDCILFLWATNPKLEQAFQVINSWGFTYKTNSVWVKDWIGPGYYFRQRHELLLLATKGEPPTPLPEKRVDSVQEYPKAGHSEKPLCYYDIIESWYPDASKYELFRRKARPGWDGWGNEIIDS